MRAIDEMTRPGALESKKTLDGPFIAVIHESVFRSKRTDLPDAIVSIAMAVKWGSVN
jgi:hypothetical protein